LLANTLKVTSTVSGTTFASHSGIDKSSGGVSIPGRNTPGTKTGTKTGTIYAGAAPSATGSTRGSLASGLVNLNLNNGTSSRDETTASEVSTRIATEVSRHRGFDPKAYALPDLDSPGGSVAGSQTGSSFAKVRAVPTPVDMLAVREQKKEIKRVEDALKGLEDVQVSDDSD
jgi:hypothetical protein